MEFCDRMLNVEFQDIALCKIQSQPIPLVVIGKIVDFMKHCLSPVIFLEHFAFIDGSMR